METNDLYQIMEEKNIHYCNHDLYATNGMIAHYKDITAIIVDDNKVKGQVAENTVLIQVEPSYMARCLNYYYKKYNGFNS